MEEKFSLRIVHSLGCFLPPIAFPYCSVSFFQVGLIAARRTGRIRGGKTDKKDD